MKDTIFPPLAFGIALLLICSIQTFAQRKDSSDLPKKVAITIDDLPLNGPDVDLNRLKLLNQKLIRSITQNRIPVVGFVNESRLFVPGEVDQRIAILRSWTDAGLELGNHTYSHLGFKDASLAQYEDDFVRGDTVTRELMKQSGQKERFYRHPFLQMGNTPELERSFEDFISARGYRIAPVTIDSLDWLILSGYLRGIDSHDKDLMRRVSDEYLKYVDRKFEYCEAVAKDIFGRPIAHILLLHANELNGDNFDALIKVLKDRGYQFVTLEEALKDSFYKSPDKYSANSDWLASWAESRGKRYDPPMPADFIMDIYKQSQKQ
jgi:peptidoglycan-N-acetylglucosamine deacetylase